MSDDLVKHLRNSRGWPALGNAAADRIEELEAKLERIRTEWSDAVQGDLEHGVASLNAAAASTFCRVYPLISAFGDTLEQILDGEQDDE